MALEDYVGLLPEGSLDSDVVSNIAGRITRLQVAGTRNGEELAYSGEGTLEAGTVTVLGTKLEYIKGLVLFNEKKIKILKIEEVLLDEKKRLIEGSEKLVINNAINQ